MLFRKAVAVAPGEAEQPHNMYTAVHELGEGVQRICDLDAVRERYQRYSPLKRTFDCINSVVLLVVCSPLFALSALAVKLSDGGPVFFRQQRLTGGLSGPRTFEILKFRTMVVNAEKLGAKITMRRDPRITGVGRLLRWFKLDELPQLINILRGDMNRTARTRRAVGCARSTTIATGWSTRMARTTSTATATSR